MAATEGKLIDAEYVEPEGKALDLALPTADFRDVPGVQVHPETSDIACDRALTVEASNHFGIDRRVGESDDGLRRRMRAKLDTIEYRKPPPESGHDRWQRRKPTWWDDSLVRPTQGRVDDWRRNRDILIAREFWKEGGFLSPTEARNRLDHEADCTAAAGRILATGTRFRTASDWVRR